MALTVGTRLGPYEILSPLGAGGMGEVFKARDTRLDRTVAIKILSPQLATDSQFRERFDREARTISQLDHPHICALHDVGEQDGTSYLVMQYLEGETLESWLKKGAVPLDQALQYALQIASALDKAHRAGIVHRDLKPGNIMLTKDGVKLLDFGLAKTNMPAGAAAGPSILPTTPPNLTAQGTILGTFQYMAPEQLEGLAADGRSDIFAFGAVLYEMLTGRKAFESKTQAGLIGAILEREPRPVSATQPVTPPALDRTVKRCLAKQPDARWQTATDLLEELKWIAGDARATPTVTISRAPWRDRAAWLIAITALLVSFAIAGLGLYVRRAASDPPVVRFDVTTPPSSDPTSFALSPDGHQLVFVANADGVPMLWLRPLDQTTAQLLAGTDGASYPFWAPDGRAIAFFADGKLKRLDLGGGTPQMLADAPTGRGGTWNRDGVILFTPNGQLGTASILMRVPATGGPVTPVTHLAAGQLSHRWPQFLPDGHRFLFFSAYGLPGGVGVYQGSLDGGEPKRLLETESAAFYAPQRLLLFVRQSALVAVPFDPDRGVLGGDPALLAESVGTDLSVARGVFSISSSGILAHRATTGQRRQLVWMNRAGTALGTVGPRDENNLGDPELSPDGRTVVVRRNVHSNVDVWLMDTTRGAPTPFTFDHSDQGAVWSPDARRIAFMSNRNGGPFELFEKEASGATGEQPLRAEVEMPLSWSPDGRFLLCSKNNAKTGFDLWALPMTDERKPIPVAQTRFNERRGQFSPDGRWVAYESNDSGVFQIYVQPFPASGGKWQVSTDGGTQVRWRHDGKELFYIASDRRLMAVSITAGADGQTLNPGEPVPLFLTHLAHGPGIPENRSQYAVARDGRFLMNVSVEEAVTAPPITVVVNWPTGLKK
jgi:serine/threonine protein kinase/Tol biopolymer transport system component